jgi:tetratricopeptide (TPR) repeat protein
VRSILLQSAVALVCLTRLTHAGGQPAAAGASAPVDSARLAEALFDEAKQAMDAGDFASACPKFEESRRLDPAGGTELALGVCYERAERLASAWNAYRVALASAERDGRADRAAIAEERLAELEPRLSRIRVFVPREVSALPMLRVDFGGLELRPPSWGLAVPYDGGSYVLRVSARGYVPWTQTVVLGASGDRAEIVVPKLTAASAESPTSNASPSRASPPAPPASSPEEKLGFVFAGAAVLALVPGIYFGGRAIAEGDAVNEQCNGDFCDMAVEQDHEEAVSDARRANVFIASGLIAASISIYFFVTAPDERVSPKAAAPRSRPTLRIAF